MKILLVGEYSRLHNSLKEGLEKLGHKVTIMACGDGFKEFPVDIKIANEYDSGLKSIVKKAIFRLFKFDISQNHIKNQIFNKSDELKGFDIVQLINESPFLTTPETEIKIFDFLKAANDKVFLLSCGLDYTSVKYASDENLKYSILTPYFKKKIKKEDFYSALKYLEPSFLKLHQHVFNNIEGVIASDIDYHLPLKNHAKYLGLIPNPINTDTIEYIEPKIDNKIIIFHGINTTSYYRKGSDIFEKALAIIQNKYADKVEVINTKNVPYKTYVNLYNKAHIVLDQIYAYDQGYNALEAMAKGKVVLTGAEQEWLDYYNLKDDTIAINALPDEQLIVEKLEWLIKNPEHISTIAKSARNFIEKEHNYLNSAEKYLEIWNK